MLAWALLCRGTSSVLHYLDDYLFSAPDATSCTSHLQNALVLCEMLGLQAEPSMVEGPATSMIFLGLKIDSVREELRLPAEKLSALKQLLAWWAPKQVATKRELKILLRHLNHAAMVVPMGKPFLRHLINAMSPIKQAFHFTRLTAGIWVMGL
jgi:hypothetical protein